MDADNFIENAIEVGQHSGFRVLDPIQRFVFAISEAEVYCDKDGIDSLLEHYGLQQMKIFADAYQAIGATEIANALTEISGSVESIQVDLLSLTNDLITERKGYTYDSIRFFVEKNMSLKNARLRHNEKTSKLGVP